MGNLRGLFFFFFPDNLHNSGKGFSHLLCHIRQHAFHNHCISKWLKTRQVCPLGLFHHTHETHHTFFTGSEPQTTKSGSSRESASDDTAETNGQKSTTHNDTTGILSEICNSTLATITIPAILVLTSRSFSVSPSLFFETQLF